jgi:hypothetical protein
MMMLRRGDQSTAGAALRASALNRGRGAHDRIWLYMKPGPGRGDKVTSRCPLRGGFLVSRTKLGTRDHGLVVPDKLLARRSQTATAGESASFCR